jgi:SAM-dependent methyltransferase
LINIETPKYATWIRNKNILIFWLVTISIIILSVIASIINIYFILISLLSLPFLYISIIITLSSYRFSENGGGYQNKIHLLIIEATQRKGPVLDIGCGSGNLIIKISKNNNEENIGIDYWGENWEYSKQQCIKNADIEKVKSITFIKASASKLPFENNTIANVVSCLTFHEVQDVSDKTEGVKEALRVLIEEGTFTFFDLFDDKKYYPLYEKIHEVISESNCIIVEEKKLSEKMRLPFPLNNKNVLKYGVLIVGKRNRTTAST